MPPELPGEEWRVVWLGHGSKLLLGAVAGLCFTAHTEALFGVHTAGQLVPALEEEACAKPYSVRTSKGVGMLWHGVDAVHRCALYLCGKAC